MIRKILGLILRVAVSVAIIWYIFSKPDTSFSGIVQTIKHIELPWLIAALVGYQIAILIASYRWQILMRAQGFSVGYLRAMALNYIGCFFNNFMLSLTGGDVVKAYYASKLTSARKAEAATIVFVDRLVGMAGLMVLGMVGSLFGMRDAKVRSAMVIIFFVVFLLALVGVLGFNKTLVRKFGKYIAHPKIKEVLKRVYEAVYFYKTRKRVLLGTLGSSVVLWIVLALMNFVLAKGLGAEVPLGYYFIFIPVINIISSIPITIAGWGLREQMYKQFFGSVGMDSGLAVSLSVACALTMLMWSLVGGVLYALRLPKFDKEK